MQMKGLLIKAGHVQGQAEAVATLRNKARRVFNDEALACSPGISTEDLDYLWHMLHRHGA